MNSNSFLQKSNYMISTLTPALLFLLSFVWLSSCSQPWWRRTRRTKYVGDFECDQYHADYDDDEDTREHVKIHLIIIWRSSIMIWRSSILEWWRYQTVNEETAWQHLGCFQSVAIRLPATINAWVGKVFSSILTIRRSHSSLCHLGEALWVGGEPAGKAGEAGNTWLTGDEPREAGGEVGGEGGGGWQAPLPGVEVEGEGWQAGQRGKPQPAQGRKGTPILSIFCNFCDIWNHNMSTWSSSWHRWVWLKFLESPLEGAPPVWRNQQATFSWL